MTTKKSSAKKTPTSPSLKYKKSLPDEIQVRLLEILSSSERHLKFAKVVKDDRRFGDPGSPLRVKILNQKRYLEEIKVTDPERFLLFFEQYKVKIPPAFAKEVKAHIAAKKAGIKFALTREQSESSSSSEDELSSASSASSSLPPPSSLKSPPSPVKSSLPSLKSPPLKVASKVTRTSNKAHVPTKQCSSVSIMVTSPSKRMTLAAMHDCDDAFELDFAVPLRNGHMIFPYRNMTSTRVLAPNVMFEMLTIVTPVMDIRDVFENRYEAELCVDDREKGIGVIITLPLLPKYIYSNAAEIHDRFTLPEVGLQRLQCHNARLEHTGVGVKIETLSEHEKTKRILCLFPPGVTCSQKFLNEDQKGNQLFRIFQNVSLSFQIVRQSIPRSIPFYGPFVMWQLCIEEQMQDLAVPAKRDNEAELQGAFAGLAFTRVPLHSTPSRARAPRVSFGLTQRPLTNAPAPVDTPQIAVPSVPTPQAPAPAIVPNPVANVGASVAASQTIPAPAAPGPAASVQPAGTPSVPTPQAPAAAIVPNPVANVGASVAALQTIPAPAAPGPAASVPPAGTPVAIPAPTVVPPAAAPTYPVGTAPADTSPIAAAPDSNFSAAASPVIPPDTRSVARAPQPPSSSSLPRVAKRTGRNQEQTSPNKASKVMRKVFTGFGAISQGGLRSTPKAMKAFRPIRFSRKKKGHQSEPFQTATQTDDWGFTSGRRVTGAAIQSAEDDSNGEENQKTN